MDLTIVTDVARECHIHFTNPDLAIAWVRVAAGYMDPQRYVDMAHALHPDDADIVSKTSALLRDCFGEGV